MVTDPFIVSVFFGFVPAMGFLYILLKEYHAFFSEKRMFRTFLLGMVMGAVLTLLERNLSPGVGQILTAQIGDPATLGGMAVFALLLGLLEAMAFAAVLNWKSFRGRRDTPFYGVAFGLGFGASAALFLMFQILRIEERIAAFTADDVWVRAILVGLLGLFFCGGILVHATIGTWIGQGTGSGGLPRAIAKAAALRGLYVALFYALINPTTPPIIGPVIAVGGVAMGIVLISRVVLNLLDNIVPPEILREMGLHQRRVGRKVLRDEPPADQTKR